jgi:polysaccharide biosynthesis/export protein
MKKSMQVWLATLLLIPAVGLCGQSGSAKPNPDDKASADKPKDEKDSGIPANVKPATEDPNYVIGPEDELIVAVWREPDISRTVPVRPDGKISLPLLNDVQAAGLTPMQLSNAIAVRLAKFISTPEVTIMVTRVTAQRIFVLGEVTRPGAYALVPGMTSLEAISGAGGLTPFAKKSKIYVLRAENGKQVRMPMNYKEIVSGAKPEQNFPLKAGDTIVVP